MREIARKKKLLVGKTVGIDATTLEANAAMTARGGSMWWRAVFFCGVSSEVSSPLKSDRPCRIVRRDSGEDWKDYLRRLAEDAGVEIDDDEDLRRFDKQRKKQGKKKVSNDEWVSASDPESRIIKKQPRPPTDQGGERPRAVEERTARTWATKPNTSSIWKANTSWQRRSTREPTATVRRCFPVSWPRKRI